MGDVDGYSQDRKVLLTELSNPECYAHEALVNCLNDLKNGKKVSIPFFDEENKMVIRDYTEINPKNETMIIIEGYFIFKDPQLREMFDLKMYTEVDDDVRLSRLSKIYYLMISSERKRISEKQSKCLQDFLSHI